MLNLPEEENKKGKATRAAIIQSLMSLGVAYVRAVSGDLSRE